MGDWIAKVHQHTIAQILGNMPLVARDDLATGGLIGPHPGMIVFGVELLCKRCGPHQVNELHRQLAPLAVRPSSVESLESEGVVCFFPDSAIPRFRDSSSVPSPVQTR